MNRKGIFLTWQNIQANVKDKQILHGITGMVSPGSTLAIMGPSGAGKTTLLSILAKKTGRELKISGKIEANNNEYTSDSFYRFASFVYQNDILNEVLTVRQTLQFSARLKIKDEAQAMERVQDLLYKFLLKKCEDTKVGGKIIKGISGGEKKRLCIALELICKPDLVVLDEPTSGLDSFMANSIINILQKLAKEDKKTIIYTIHQPSYKIYHQLDKLILLNQGYSIYQGPAADISKYMQNLNISIPPKTTICDYFMFQISEFKQRTQQYTTLLTGQSYSINLKPKIQKQIETLKNESDFQQIPEKQTAQSFFKQFLLLLQREVSLLVRNPMKIGQVIGNAIIMIILNGLIFYHSISDNRPEADQTYPYDDLILYFIQAQGICFICVTSIIMTGIFSVALVFPLEREVYSKEVSSKTYNSLPYFISKLMIEISSLWFGVLLFCSGVFWLIGYTTSFLIFIRFTFTLVGCASVGSSIGLLTGSFFQNAQRASSMAPIIILPLMMFSGLYNKLSDIPIWIRWLQYISPFRYGLHALLLNQYGDEIYYDSHTGSSFNYQEIYSINLNYIENIGVLLGLAFLYYFLAYICLKLLKSTLSA